MRDFSLGSAIDFFEECVLNAQKEAFYTEEYLQLMIQHCLLAATCAEIISSKLDDIDTEKAYALGLLHDCGKFISPDSKESFHGLVGYWAMKKKGWDLVANICLTHTFQEEDFLVSDFPSYGEKNVAQAKKELKKVEVNDYSKLIQISDLIVNVVKFDTLRQRMIFIKNTHNADIKILKKKYKAAMKLKKYFDEKCGCDIYDLLGIKI